MPVTLQASKRSSYTTHTRLGRRKHTYRGDLFRSGRDRTDSASIFDECLKPENWTIKTINLRPRKIEIGSRKVLLYGASNAF